MRTNAVFKWVARNALIIYLLACGLAVRADDDAAFIGTFSSDDLTLTLKAAGNGYEGTIARGSGKFPVKAISNAANLQGSFSADGIDINFNGTLKDNHLTLATGGKTYELTKAGAAGNPGTAANAGAGASSSSTLVMKKQMVHDSFFNKDAYSMMVPDQWTGSGRVTWVPGRIQPDVYFAVIDPTKTEGYQQFPRIFYQAGVRENADFMFPRMAKDNDRRFAEGQLLSPTNFEIRKVPSSPKEYLIDLMIPAYCKGIAQAADRKVVSETDLADYAKSLTERDPGHRQITAGKLRISFTGPNGPTEAEFICAITLSPLPPARAFGGRQCPTPRTLWSADTCIWRAPAGKLDAMLPTFATIRSSITEQLPWFNVRCEFAEQILAAQAKAEDDMLRKQADSIMANLDSMHEAAMKQSDDLSDRIKQNFADQQAAKAESQTREMNYIKNTGNYRDPQTGGLVNLSEDYKYHFSDGNNHIIETNDPNPGGFAPNELKSMDRVN